MENLATKLDGTARHLITEGGAFLARTRDAGQAFVAETEKAGAVFVRAARTEARSWFRALRSTRTTLKRPAELARSRAAIERRVLTRVDAALAAASQRIKDRIGQLEPQRRAAAARRRAPTKTRTRRTTRTARPAVPIAA